ncbi:MAG: thermonuclease family protein [Clostridiales bacterium]|nr:thermonuclease family protein [Clostridiales bacterium]
MKKNIAIRTLCALIAVVLLAVCLAGCGSPADNKEDDLSASVKLDRESGTKQLEVTVKQYVDGDTTHFYVSDSAELGTDVLKARYLAVNTPESTGKIEEYGKKAAAFTREKLESAVSIIVESDDGNWNLDSTGTRYLVWVWYKPSEDADYINLNIEILQNGLAIASNSGNNRYGSTCLAAIAKAKELKLNVHSGQKDPDFFYGSAIEVDLKEIRTNLESYSGKKVAFTGVVTKNNNNTVYVESYDSETDIYYGIAVYYGFNLAGEGLEIIKVGNEARIVGTVQFYEAGGTYQVSGLQYRIMKPDDPDNLKLISTGKSGAYVLTDPEKFNNEKVSIITDDELKEFSYAELTMDTTIEMHGLKVTRVNVTENEDSSSYGSMTLSCSVNGQAITVRTNPFYENGELITKDYFQDKTIDVKGLVSYYKGEYQIKVISLGDIQVGQ